MKKLLIFPVILMVLMSCIPDKRVIKGWIVHREYIAGHMCHSDYKEVNYAVIVVPHVTSRHMHQWKPSEFNIFIADRSGVKSISVDSLDWIRYRCGQRVELIIK